MPAPEWKWKEQEAAPAYSTEHGSYKFLSRESAEQLLNVDAETDDSTSPQEDALAATDTSHGPKEDDSDRTETDSDDASTTSHSQYVPTSALWQRTLMDHDDPESTAFPITLEQALQGEHAEDANPAVDDELDNMADNNNKILNLYPKK